MNHSLRLWWWAACGAGVIACAEMARAQGGAPAGVKPEPETALPAENDQAPLSPADVDRFGAAVQSADFHERDSATRGALEDDRFTLPVLERLLRERGAAMSAEGRERVLFVARDRFNRTGRGAMGISFGGREQRLFDRVIVGQTYAGFESDLLLKPGDIITHAAGEELRGPDAQPKMMAVIVSHDPGDAIPLVIRRGAEKVRVDVRLRSFSDLPNTMMDLERLARAWKFRARSYTPGAAEPIRIDVGAGEWDKGRRNQVVALRQARRTQLKDQSRLPDCAGGGMARLRLGDSEQGSVQMVVFNGVQRPMRIQIAGQFIEDARPPMTMDEEVRAVWAARKSERLAKATDADAPKRMALLAKLEDALRADAAERGESLSDIPPDFEVPEEPQH